MIKSGMETPVFGSNSKTFKYSHNELPSDHVEHWSWIQNGFAMVDNI